MGVPFRRHPAPQCRIAVYSPLTGGGDEDVDDAQRDRGAIVGHAVPDLVGLQLRRVVQLEYGQVDVDGQGQIPEGVGRQEPQLYISLQSLPSKLP